MGKVSSTLKDFLDPINEMCKRKLVLNTLIVRNVDMNYPSRSMSDEYCGKCFCCTACMESCKCAGQTNVDIMKKIF